MLLVMLLVHSLWPPSPFLLVIVKLQRTSAVCPCPCRRHRTDERDAIQKKTFTKWVNKHLKKVRHGHGQFRYFRNDDSNDERDVAVHDDDDDDDHNDVLSNGFAVVLGVGSGVINFALSH